MEQDIPLITTVAAAFGAALVFGLIAERIRIPALVGYLLAGIVLGPSTPGMLADAELARQLAEIGVMLLMFGVGLHFSIDDLLDVKGIAVPGAVVQMGLATMLGTLMAHLWWNWPWGSAFVFGVSLTCASTVVLLKAMEVRGLLDTMDGRIAVGWLIVEDLATVVILVLLPLVAGVLGAEGADAGNGPLGLTVALTLLQVGAFVALMLIIGRRVLPVLLWQVAHTGSRELFTLAVLACAIGIAYGASTLFGVSFALGAFFAGMVMRESEFSHRAAEESLPLRDAFSVLFFVSVGMLFEPSIIVDKPWHVLGTVGIVIFGKSAAAWTLVLLLRYPLHTAGMVAASLAQIGEFSFILAGLGLTLGLLPAEGMNLILAGALISIALNPLVFYTVEPVRRWMVNNIGLARRFEAREDPYTTLPMTTGQRYLQGQVVLVGYGRVGRRIARVLDDSAIPYVVAEDNRELVEDLRERGIPAVYGNAAADPAVLIQAHVAHAALLVIAIPDPVAARKMVETARQLNPNIETVLRTPLEDAPELLANEAVDAVFSGEAELAKGMAQHVLDRVAPRR